MNRVDKLRALAALEAAAGEIRAALKADAAAAFVDDGVVVSWRTIDGTLATGSMSHDRCEIADRDEFLAWLVQEFPQLVHTVVDIRNPDVVKKMLEGWAQQGPGLDGGSPAVDPQPPELSPGESWSTAAKIPGVVFVKGGMFGTLSITVDRAVKKRLASAARAWVLGVRPGPLDLTELVRTAYELEESDGTS